MTDGYTVSIDWNADGDVTDPNDDVTDDLLGSVPVTYSYGRDQARQLSPPAVGRIAVALCNDSRIYSPENSASPLAGDFTPSSPLQIEAELATVTYSLGTGRIEDYDVHPDRGNRTVDIVALDGLGQLAGIDISTELHEARRTGALIGIVLDAAGWTGPRDLDLGATFVPWWWAEGTDAFSAIADLLLVEGPPSIAYIAPDGTFTFRDRHHRLLYPASLTSQASFAAEAVDCSPVVEPSGELGRLLGLDSAVTLNSGDFATVTVPNDGSVAVGDLLLVGCVMPSGSRTFTISGGGGTWNSLGSAAQSGHTSQLWWRIAEAGDLGANVTVTPSSVNIRQVLLLGAVSGVDQDMPIAGSNSMITPATVAGVTTPTVSSIPAGAREISVLWDSRGNSTPNTSDWAEPAGMTNQLQAFTTDSNGASSGAMGDSIATVSGTVGARLWTPDRGAVGSAWTLAINPVDPDTIPLDYTPPFEYRHGGRDIINTVTVDVDRRVESDHLQVVWESTATHVLSLGESATVRVQATDPFVDALPLVAGTDYVSSGPGTVQVTLSRRSGQSLVITLLAIGGATTVTRMQLRARPVSSGDTVQVVQDDSVSIAQHGRRSPPQVPPSWIGVHDAAAVGQLLLAYYAQRRPLVAMRVVAQDTTHHTQILARTISDRISIRNGELGLDSDFHVERVEHTIRRINQGECPGPVHAVVFGCEQAPGAAQGPVLNPFTFNKTGAGFNDGVFDPTAADDPSSIFIFDHETQGQFNVGAFAT